MSALTPAPTPGATSLESVDGVHVHAELGFRPALAQVIVRNAEVPGNILEPACGVGNFFGLLPESMAESRPG